MNRTSPQPYGMSPWLMREAWQPWERLFHLGNKRQWSAKEVLYGAGCPTENIVLITDGLIKVMAQGLNGNQRGIAILGAGSVLGETALFSGKSYQHIITCVENCSGVEFSKNLLFEQVLGRDTELTLYLMRNLAEKSYIMSSQLECQSFMSSEQLVAHFLYHLYLEQEKGSWIYHKISPLSLTTLAELVGLHRVTLTRIIGDLIKNGILSNVERKLRVNDLEAVLRILRASCR